MKGAILLLLIAGVASPLVVGFHVEPVKAQWSGWTSQQAPNNRVSEVLTINFDELDSTTGAYVELFAGEYGSGGDYNLNILTYPGGTPIASKPHGKYVRPQYWVRFDSINVIYPESIVKGKKLEFRFTRSGSDSIQYYFDEACGYNYGLMIAPYPQWITPDFGLAMRCYGYRKVGQNAA